MSKSLLALGITAVLGVAGWTAAGEVRGVERLKQELGLSDAQVEQLHGLRAEQRKAAVQRRGQIQVARLELRELLEAQSVDEGAVRAKAKQLGDLQASAARAHAEAGLA